MYQSLLISLKIDGKGKNEGKWRHSSRLPAWLLDLLQGNSGRPECAEPGVSFTRALIP
jgi:hypothetical protein